ncbi:hypothetical protein BDK51DRAFT_43546 [Blyttiomyces helicus]|uniref:Uncharacterized protein n=1 Tax=Blyttiomyces helicus TaxID=388810 RepID=A0A4V1IST3_9FUNG|nr:hypothetical protein BDK51DRAFT_43546 [Blyttiomyces helicus]|eukprot:RKO94657.1 hypothetical protein BDK51DRAFT_43546 [Blyttiomyces helicus]
MSSDKPTGNGDHVVRASVHVWYFLEKCFALDSQAAGAGKKGEKGARRRRNPMEDYRKFYLTYNFGGAFEGKTDVLSWDGSLWGMAHEVEINSEVIMNIYENPVEFCIYEIVRNEDAAQMRVPGGLRQQLISKNARVGSKLILNATRSTEARKTSLDALAKRRFILANSTIPLRERYIVRKQNEIPRRGTLPVGLRSNGPAIGTGSSHLRGLAAPREVDPIVETDFLVKVAAQRSMPDLRDIDSPEPADHAESENILSRASRPSEIQRVVDSTPAPGPASTESVPLHHEVAHKPAPDYKRQGPQPHHFDRPQRHMAGVSLGGMRRATSFGEVMGIGRRQIKPWKSVSDGARQGANLEPEHALTATDKRNTSESINDSSRDHITNSEAEASAGSKEDQMNEDPERGRASRRRSSIKGAKEDEERGRSRRRSTTREKGTTDIPGMSWSTKQSNERHQFKGRKGRSQSPTDPDARRGRSRDRSGSREREKPRRQSHDIPRDDLQAPNKPTKDHRYSIATDAAPPKLGERQKSRSRPLKPKEDEDEQAVDSLLRTKTKEENKKKKPEFKHVMLAKIGLDVTELFLGEQTISAHLNPLCLTIVEMDGMPNTPIPYGELTKQCQPVHARFRFYEDAHVHQSTTGQPHGRRIEFGTRHLILPGLMDEDALRDYLLNKTLSIEVHDRDYRMPEDLMLLSHEMNSEGAIKVALNPRNPFGMAVFSLADLAKGATSFESCVPILPAKYQKGDQLARPQEKAKLPAGLWLESAATLSISIHMRYPILATTMRSAGSLADGLFGRAIIVTSVDDEATISEIQWIVERCNFTGLKLERDAEMTPREILMSHRLSPEQRGSVDLDILTGYEIFDADMRIYFVEGLLDRGIVQLLQALHSVAPYSPSMRVWHTPVISFTQRIWTTLVPGIVRIRLEPSLKNIMATTSTYLRRRMPVECFECLNMLHQILFMNASSTPSSMLGHHPSNSMINTLLSSFGELVTYDTSLAAALGPSDQVSDAPGREFVSEMRARVDFESARQSVESWKAPQQERELIPRIEKKVENDNFDFVAWKQWRKLHEPNFIRMRAKVRPIPAAALIRLVSPSYISSDSNRAGKANEGELRVPDCLLEQIA